MKRLLLIALVLSGCGRRDRIVVGRRTSPNRSARRNRGAAESSGAHPLPVERRLHLGGTFVCHRAITAGDIDLYVEYTGTAFTAILKQTPIADADSVYRFVAARYLSAFQLRWTDTLGFNNTFAILVRRAECGALRLAIDCGSGAGGVPLEGRVWAMSFWNGPMDSRASRSSTA